MQITNKGRLFGIPLYALVLILLLVLTSAGVIAGNFLDLSIASIFGMNQPETATSIQSSIPSASISAPQVSDQPNVLVENKEWTHQNFAQSVSFQANILVENKEWAPHYPAKQIPFQSDILVENKEWSQ